MQKAISKIDIVPLEEAVLGAIWIQWRSLGTFIDSDRLARAMVDPEALLLISLTLRHHERRLWDLLVSWATNGSQLFSLQRVKNLINYYPDLIKDRVAEFAHHARVEGNDFRWHGLAGADAGPDTRKQGLWRAYPSIWHPSALLLRMRLGFGMGISPDLLCFLISRRGEWTSAIQLAPATSYSPYSIRRVADDMASAQLIERTQTKPVQYRVNVERWSGLLGIDSEAPYWRPWHHIYALVTKVIISHESGEWAGLSPYLLSTKLRDLAQQHQDVFLSNHIDLPDPRKYIGEAYLPAFAEAMNNLAVWIKNEA